MLTLLPIWLLLALPANVPAAHAPARPWRLVWADEFNTAGSPNAQNWTFEKGFVRNHELQWYQPQNATCAHGSLLIEARRTRRPNPGYQPGSADWKASRDSIRYTSASLQTRGRHQWQYGRFEMRAKIDVRPGRWPAFWTLGAAGEWPASGEIDIMEYYRGTVLANFAWGTAQRYTPHWQSVKKPLAAFHDPAWAQKFHVWRMDWEPDSIKLLLDGRVLNAVAVAKTVNADGTNPFRQPHYVLLNLALGGDNGGDPAGTTFPARFEVDYVRVYQH
ncbi:glycoside hydrolase family 16 protein [Hymenobacter sp. UV11]|uniref:glycoside hydrolase family 16 protein n=1 Tax=Hymenobacter sp. UV11 TaxID=1849735 RepID=UPI00105E765E|nr:glycoside hydrolase family 16 protein [Hymenobacter sp. UV11]TDN37568.1 beta-glucanase [Hymenobacter sp. UV11]TFZ68764.1 glycoside hydrolase family 16 protein [Hymenobacter sp. UV11]